MRAMHKAGQAPARLSHSGKRGKGDAPFPIRSALRTASNLIWLRNYRSRPASIQFPRNWPISQFRAVHFPSPLGRGCAETLSRGPGFRGCDREGAHKHADQCGAASRSGVASKHNTLGTCSALRGRRGEGRAAQSIFAELVRRPSGPARGDIRGPCTCRGGSRR